MQSNTEFRTSDIVRLRNGSAPLDILKIRHQQRQALLRYVSSRGVQGARHFWRHFDEITHYDPQPQEVPMTTPNTLYKVNATGRIGTYIAEDGDNQFVLNMSDGGYEAFPASDLTKVCPYTILVDFPGNGGSEHYKLSKDAGVRVSDILIIDGGFGVVRKLDTQKDGARVPKTLRRVLTEEL